MKKIYSALLLSAMSWAALAQSPQYYNSTTVGGSNVFPFGNTTTRKVQWRFPANTFGTSGAGNGNVGSGNNITTVYFYTSTNTSNTYPILNIRLKQNGNGLVGGGNFDTGMTLVYQGTNVTKTGVTNGWMQFILQTPFTYDPSQPLLIEVEHNATSGTGPYINQTTTWTGPGFGREWGDYGNSTYSGGDANVVGFGIDVVPNTPCTVTPGPNTIVPVSYSACAGGQNPSLGVANSYSFGGITYQWQMSTQSSAGQYTAMTGYTNSAVQMPTLAATSWFQLVATCTNVTNGSTTLSPIEVYVYPPYVGTAPYHESFESIGMNNKLPNCSWFSQQLGAGVETYTSANTNGRVARTGNAFSSFYMTPYGAKTVYTHGMQLEPGVTYSASLWYQTEYYGYNNWTDLSILVGPSQSATGQTTIVSTNGPAISNVYKPLSGTFQVPTSGIYYVAVRGTAVSGSAQYLTWDDLAIEIPCSLNTPSLTVASSQGTICAGQQVVLTAGGVDSYLWSTGDQGNSINVTPPFPGPQTYYVTGTSTLTGCSLSIPQYVMVNPTPEIYALSVPATACDGQQVILYAAGADNYIWSNNTTGAVVSMIATSPGGTVAVSGTNQYNCQSTAVINLVVHAKPNVSAVYNSTMCVGEPLTITSNVRRVTRLLLHMECFTVILLLLNQAAQLSSRSPEPTTTDVHSRLLPRLLLTHVLRFRNYNRSKGSRYIQILQAVCSPSSSILRLQKTFRSAM